MKTESERSCVELEETTKVLSSNGRDSDLPEDATTPDGSPPLECGADNSWEDQLNICKERIEELQEHYDQSFLEIGRVLIQARNIYKGHGNWGKWLNQNVPFSVRHAQRLIRVAELVDGNDDVATTVSQLKLTPSKLYTLTRVGKDDIAHFLGMFFRVGGRLKSVSDLTKRELELEVSSFLRHKLVSTDYEEVTADQGGEILKKSDIESNFEELKKILNKTIISIKDSDSNNRQSWISELDELYRSGLDRLSSATE